MIYFFFDLGFLSQTSTNHRTAGEVGGHFLTPHYHFYLLHLKLGISRAITEESLPLHIASSRTRTGNLWFPSTFSNCTCTCTFSLLLWIPAPKRMRASQPRRFLYSLVLLTISIVFSQSIFLSWTSSFN